MLGTVAGNLAMTLGALGGMYIGGGIVPRLGHLFTGSQFRNRFEAKGRFSTYLSQIPTHVITAEYPAFLGVSAILTEKTFELAPVRPERRESGLMAGVEWPMARTALRRCRQHGGSVHCAIYPI